MTKHLFDKFNMKVGQTFLEVGCGRGEFLSGFSNLGLKAYGSDLSAEAKIFNQVFKYLLAISKKNCLIKLSPFIPVRTKNKFFRWSRELMFMGCAYK
ncbi:class I SAM-dependent methyltransferase [Pigmentibacter sp. JX0631]|uniref:class I SAM-dependent methyltransferase n=1 Tax=Pigmentibacter sp. JX0631 TaxID=2976982 RepID=UPI002468B749|nr:class I SAM-dependent methyltransferase [Pigmentibacter sp. JX0631]WGL60838.1 class I SAM-dependent methyltransferase [Pigmentibacter sp. JX0631]